MRDSFSLPDVVPVYEPIQLSIPRVRHVVQFPITFLSLLVGQFIVAEHKVLEADKVLEVDTIAPFALLTGRGSLPLPWNDRGKKPSATDPCSLRR